VNENAKKWVKALRSGKYKQGKNSLRVDGTYCCLGVACDLYAKETGLGKWEFYEDVCLGFLIGSNLEETTLPHEVKKWLGLRDCCGLFIKDGKTDYLTELNDARDYTFKEIADLVESEPEWLFVEE